MPDDADTPDPFDKILILFMNYMQKPSGCLHFEDARHPDPEKCICRFRPLQLHLQAHLKCQDFIHSTDNDSKDHKTTDRSDSTT
jgi:hypothetical protein